MFPGSGSILFNTTVNTAGYNHHDNEDGDEDEEEDDDDEGNESFSYWDNNKPFHVIDCLERYRNIRRNHAALTTTNAGTISQLCLHSINLVHTS